MPTKRKIRKYKTAMKNPRKKKPLKDITDRQFEISKYYDLDRLKFRSPNTQNFSKLQKNHPDKNGLEYLFEESLEGFLFKSPFSRDDISFFRYGVFMRSQGHIPASMLNRIKEVLIGSKGTLSVIHEQQSDALLIRFGNNRRMVDADKVVRVLDQQQILISSIYEILADYGDVYWGLEFETEEVFY